MTYEEFIGLVSLRHHGASAFSGMCRRGWTRTMFPGETPSHRWIKSGAGGRKIAEEGDETWKADTQAEWKAQHG